MNKKQNSTSSAPHIKEERPHILLVDDDQSILEVMKMRLELMGYKVSPFSDPEDAYETFKKEGGFDLLLTDQKMAGLTGQELMELCLKEDPTLQTIIFTAYGTIEQAVQAVKAGAYSFITKPINHDELTVQIEQAIEKRALLRKIRYLENFFEKQDSFEGMVGTGPKMKEIFKKIMQIAPTRATVSIYGESGTGKELVARAIHFYSKRAKAPFIAINCAAIPETLLEDELFGHVKGAFTGATSSKEGLFTQADKGTLFMDEVGEMSKPMQAKLLRVLETGEVRPVGGEKVKTTDVRLIVATKRDLKEMVDKGEFREDLYYRIHVVPIYMPPLRERREDILPLTTHFLEKFVSKMDKKIRGIEEEVLEAFKVYDWPGNIRELENIVEYLVAMCPGDVIDIALLENTPLENIKTEKAIKPLREAKDEFIKAYLENLFQKTRGNISKAAQEAGYYRADFYKLFKKYGIDPKKYKNAAKIIEPKKMTDQSKGT